MEIRARARYTSIIRGAPVFFEREFLASTGMFACLVPISSPSSLPLQPGIDEPMCSAFWESIVLLRDKLCTVSTTAPRRPTPD